MTRALVVVALLWGMGCDAGVGSVSDDQAAQRSGAGLTCTPLQPRPCACLYGDSMGSQSCLPGGDGFGPCSGCLEEPSSISLPGPTGGAAAGTSATVGSRDASAGPDAAGSGGGGMSGVAGEGPGAGGAGGTGPDDSEADLLGEGTAEGPSCGVGLPAQCELETEKCCVRSLMTDTCIDAAAECQCDLPGCAVMVVHCDGPEDCPDGQQCCGTLSQGGGAGYQDFRCAESCDYAGSQRLACHQGETECPGNNECANSQLLTNIQVCIDPRTIQQ